jgi:hypothetical protein
MVFLLAISTIHFRLFQEYFLAAIPNSDATAQKEAIMRIFTLGLMIFGFLISTQVRAEDSQLKPVMASIGRGFKASFKAARKGNNSSESQLVVEKLVDSIRVASELLPPAVDPTDSVVVARYRGLLTKLLEQAILLQDAFLTEPMAQPEALEILKAMNALRKKGHGIFR